MAQKTPPFRSQPTTDLAQPDVPDDIELEPEPERGPLRRCIVTREQGERQRMLRFVVGPENVIIPDLAARLPGRGIWLSARADVIHSARTRQAFARAARARVTVPDDLAVVISTGLLGRIADLVGFARRAGQAVAGYQKAHEWLAAGRAALIIQARDGSADERARFMGNHTNVPVIAPLPAARLGAVFGRQTAVHVAIGHGRLAASLRIEAERLAGVAGGTELAGHDGSGQIEDADGI